VRKYVDQNKAIAYIAQLDQGPTLNRERACACVLASLAWMISIIFDARYERKHPAVMRALAHCACRAASRAGRVAA
jgi:hypothetical protein